MFSITPSVKEESTKLWHVTQVFRANFIFVRIELFKIFETTFPKFLFHATYRCYYSQLDPKWCVSSPMLLLDHPFWHIHRIDLYLTTTLCDPCIRYKLLEEE